MSGIFGVVSKGSCAETLFYGTDYHSHLGTEFGGMAVLGTQFKRQIHDLRQAQFKSKFFEDYKHMDGNRGIGVVSAIGEQQIYLNSKFGPFCLVVNGMVENAEELAAGLLKKGVSFSEMSTLAVNMAELIAKLITHAPTRDGAIAVMKRALEEFKIEPQKTTIPLYRKIMEDTQFHRGDFDTGYIHKFIPEQDEEND